LICAPINYTCFNLIAQLAQDANDVRWQTEEFHRELKQLSGFDNANAVRPALNDSTSFAAIFGEIAKVL